MSITKKIDAITSIPDNVKTTTPIPPRSVKIELTGRCNYRCSFCALRSRGVQPTKDMDFSLFKKITREMKSVGVEEIGVFYLGESFTTPKFLVNAVKFLKEEVQMPYVFLTTNGSLATPEIVRELMEAKLDSLKWSVNAADREQFYDVMQVKPDLFDKSLDNLKMAKEITRRKLNQRNVTTSSLF